MERDDRNSERWAFKPGDSFNQYTVLRLLGAGLHGEVYLVEHRLTGDRFALKVMHLEDVRDARRVRRALSTALASYRIQHANVVTVHDIGCEEDGKVWVRMEYLDGGSIGELLARQRGRISLQLAFHIAIEAAWAIDAAHEMQIIHRDVKPENVWLTAAGVVKVIDFSLAKVIPDGVQTTQRKTGFGTAPYMAPEALKGAEPDARVDIYALAMMLWQMLGGRHPWSEVLRNTTEMIRRQLHVMPPPLSSLAGLPPYVDDFMLRALAKDPAERFMSIAEMAQAMMALRDRLWDDAGRGLVDVQIPPGEPRVSTEPRAARQHHGTYEVSESAPEPGHASARVLVAGAQSLPMGPGGTLPLASTRSALIEQCGAAPWSASTPTGEQATPQINPPFAPEMALSRATPASARDAASGVTLGAAPVAAPAVARPWSRLVLVVLALVSALVASVSVAAWRRARAAEPPALSASSASAVPAAKAPEPEGPALIDTAAPSAVPEEIPPPPATAATIPAPAGPARTPARASSRSSAKAPAVPLHAATVQPTPPPSAATSASKPASNRLFDSEP